MNQSAIGLHDDALAYALDALDDLERARFQRHLDDCAECQDEVADLREALREFGDSTQPVAPPSELRSELMDQLRRTPQVTKPRPIRERATRPRTRTRTHTRVENIRKPVYAAFAAAAAILGFGVLAMHPWTTPSTSTLSAVQRVEQAPDAHTVRGDYKGGEVSVTSSASLGSTVVVTRNLPTLPADKVYQMWAIKGSTPISVGVIGAKGSAVFPPAPAGTASMAVTVEPLGGSREPTSTPIVTVAA